MVIGGGWTRHRQRFSPASLADRAARSLGHRSAWRMCRAVALAGFAVSGDVVSGSSDMAGSGHALSRAVGDAICLASMPCILLIRSHPR